MKIKQVKDNLSAGVLSTFGFLFSSIVTMGISYITIPLYTRLLSPDDYGQVSVYLTWTTIIGYIAMFCLSYGVFNNGMIEYPQRRTEYTFSLLNLSNIITIITFILISLVYPFISSILGIDYVLIVLMFLGFLFQPAYSFWFARQRYELKYKGPLIWSAICGVISPLIAVICILAFPGYGVYARIIGAEIPLILIYAFFYIRLGKRSKWKVDRSFWKAAFLFNLPLIPHYLSTFLLSSSDKIMISYIVGDAATAFYSVAHSVAAVAAIIWTAINGSLVPYTYEKCKDKDYAAINKITLPLVLLVAVGCVCVIMMAPEIVKIMATDAYYESISVIPPIVGGIFFQTQYYLYANVLYYYKKPKYVMIGSVVATVLNIVLNYIFISKYGYMAAGYTTIVCYLIQALIDYWGLRHVVKEKVYNMKFIVLLSVAILLISIISPLLYNDWIIRYVILLCVLGVILLNINKIKSIFAKIK
jgi:O-antigen/teichoic acid export membrane protein